MSSDRVRRTPEAARVHILTAAAALLEEGGPSAVQVRAVSRRAKMTDSGVLHHFKTRDGLMRALLDDQSSKLRDAIALAVRDWRAGEPDLPGLVDLLAGVYGRGYARLALQLYEAGWRDRGDPLLEPVVEALLRAHASARADDVRIALASLHQWLALDPLFGSEFRRSVGGLDAEASSRQRRWYLEALRTTLRGAP